MGGIIPLLGPLVWPASSPGPPLLPGVTRSTADLKSTENIVMTSIGIDVSDIRGRSYRHLDAGVSPGLGLDNHIWICPPDHRWLHFDGGFPPSDTCNARVYDPRKPWTDHQQRLPFREAETTQSTPVPNPGGRPSGRGKKTQHFGLGSTEPATVAKRKTTSSSVNFETVHMWAS